MQWSDETVERVALELRDKHPVPMGFEDSRWLAKAALTAVAECKEVRELVESLIQSTGAIEAVQKQRAIPVKDDDYVLHFLAKWKQALAPFVGASCNK